jgi:hypothetical protein
VDNDSSLKNVKKAVIDAVTKVVEYILANEK